MKKLIMIVFVLCVMLSAVGCYGSNNVVESTPTNEAPVVTQVPKTNKELYAEVLGNYFTALNYKWDKSVLYEMGLSTFLAACYDGDPYMNVGYAFFDLNADGVDELLIGPAKDEYSFKEVVFALYTLQDGKPERINISSEQNSFGIRIEDETYVIEDYSADNAGQYLIPEYISFKDGSILE